MVSSNYDVIYTLGFFIFYDSGMSWHFYYTFIVKMKIVVQNFVWNWYNIHTLFYEKIELLAANN